MKLYPTLFLLFSTTFLTGQSIIEPCKTGQSLMDAIRISYKPDSTLGYGPARDTLYSKIDNNGLELSGIYTDFTVTLVAGVDPSISAFQNEQGLNAEHVYPQSKGARDEPGRSDMHNLYPSKVNVNSARGSCVFGDIEDSDTEFWFILGERLSQIPATDIDGYSEKDEESCVFEPRESVKGDIARSVFYFYTIYQSKANQADSNFFNKQKETLFAWHQADPVSEKEIRRNELIAFYQGNLNPFTADATLAERAFFKEDASYEAGNPNCVVTSTTDLVNEKWIDLQSNLVQHTISLASTKRKVQALLINTNGQLLKETHFNFDTQIEVGHLPTGYYFLYLQSEGLQEIFKVAIF